MGQLKTLDFYAQLKIEVNAQAMTEMHVSMGFIYKMIMVKNNAFHVVVIMMHIYLIDHYVVSRSF